MQLHVFFHSQEVLMDARVFHCEAKFILLGAAEVDSEVVVEFHHSCFSVVWFSHMQREEAEIIREVTYSNYGVL